MKKISRYPAKGLLLFFFFCALSLSAFAQQLVITGQVIDATGLSIPGVSVQLKAAKSGVATDINGKYSVKANKGDVITFTSVGFDPQEVTVGNQTVINVTLTTGSKQLNELVVIGYGTQKRGDITGAVASLKADKLDERPLLRVDQALVGQLAGVTVKQSSGVPGKGFNIQVRGTGSITAGNEPLYVIDGFALNTTKVNGSNNFAQGNPLDNINPNDIQSIEVLKDAAAAAIYGSRAANGVVLITTKRGQAGKAQITYNAYVGYNQANRGLQMMNGDQWVDRATEIINAQWVASGAGRTASQTNEQRRVILGLAPGTVNTALMTDDRWFQPGHPGLAYIDWQKETFRKGIVQNHQIAASGGSDNVKYYMSGNYTKQDGMVKFLDYTAYSGRANIEVNASKKIKLGINVAPTYSVTHDPGVEGKDNILHQLLSMTPVQEDTAGVNANIGKNAQYRWSVSTNSPVGKLSNIIGLTKRYRTIASIYGDYEIFKGLNLRSSLNLDNTDNSTKGYTPYTVTGALAVRLSNGTVNTSGSYSTYHKQTFSNENTLTYSKTIANDHSLNVLLGESYNTNKLDASTLSSNGGFSSSVITTLSAANGVTGNSTETKDVLLSYFSRVQYSYKSRYLLTGSIRRDGSSRFGANTKYGTFASGTVGWRIIDESFARKIKQLSDLKVRFSYGQAGNNNIGDYSGTALTGAYNYTVGGVAATGQTTAGIINPNISWEKSTTKDFGVDFGFFSNRLTGSFDYYDKLNTDLLFFVPTLGVTGFGSFLDNAGSVRNKGWELELTSRNLTGKFSWSTTVNLSHNTNKVESLPNGQTQLLFPSSFDIAHTILQVGQPLYSIYAIRRLGVLSQADIDSKAALYGTEVAGDPKYEDINKDGVIDANDRQIVGHPNPNYIWGITNTFNYKGFDLTVLVQGQNGGSIYSLLGRALDRTGQGFTDNTPAYYVNRWRSASDPGNGTYSKAYSTFGRIINTDWLYSSDYVRVRNITLGYNLGNIMKKGVVRNARIYLTAENFFGHDKYYGGLNPEAANTDLSGSTTYPEPGDYGGLPLAKSLIFGVNITF